MSFTQDIHILRSPDIIKQEIEKESLDIANKIKDTLTELSYNSKDGFARQAIVISELHKKKVLEMLACWAKMYGYKLEYSNKSISIYPKIFKKTNANRNKAGYLFCLQIILMAFSFVFCIKPIMMLCWSVGIPIMLVSATYFIAEVVDNNSKITLDY